MKLLKKRTLFMIMMFLVIFSNLVFADDSLKITNWMTDAALRDNGDLNITEDIEFEFDGDYNGVFRTLSLNDLDSVEDISLSEVGKGKEYIRVKDAKNGDKNVFTVTEDKNSLEIKIYAPSKDEKKTFRISYRIIGVPIKYNDIAELNYNFIGEENETEIDKFSAVLKLPFPFTKNRVKIFGHGPLQGNVEYSGEDSIKIEVENIDGGENVTLRTLFPTRFIKNSTNIRNEDAFDRIMNEESARIEKAEKRNSLKDLISMASLYIGMGATALIVLLITVFRRKKKDKLGGVHIESRMESSTPAEVSILLTSIIGDNAIIATMLDLARKGYIDIEMDKDIKDSTVITKKRETDDRLTEAEKHFLNFFLNKVGDGSRVSTEEIKKYSEKYKSIFSEFITKWTEKVNEHMRNEGYFNPRDKKIGSIIMVGFVILTIVSFVLFIYVGEGRMSRGALFVIVSFIGLFYGIYIYSRKSNKGYREYKAWNKFKTEMNSIKKDKTNIDLEEILKYPLETTLIYSIATGVKEEVIDKFKVKIKEDEQYYSNYSINPWLIWYVFYGGGFNNNINQSLTNSSSYSGGNIGAGGGFTGGGGGAGGGGAGGF